MTVTIHFHGASGTVTGGLHHDGNTKARSAFDRLCHVRGRPRPDDGERPLGVAAVVRTCRLGIFRVTGLIHDVG